MQLVHVVSKCFILGSIIFGIRSSQCKQCNMNVLCRLRRRSRPQQRRPWVRRSSRANGQQMEDLGSGVLIDFSKYGQKKEPTIFESLNSGIDLITFSGGVLKSLEAEMMLLHLSCIRV